MKFKNLVLTLGVLMMLAFTSMAAAAPSQVNRSMTAINAAKAEIPAVCELVGYNVDGDTSIITFKDHRCRPPDKYICRLIDGNIGI